MNILLNPLFIFWCLLGICLFLYKFSRKKAAKFIFYIALAELFVFSSTPVPDLMVNNLEKQFPVFNPEQYPEHVNILVLGGGHENDVDMLPSQRLNSSAMARVAEGIRIYKKSKSSKVIFSGYSLEGASHAKIASLAAVELGLDPADTLLSPKPADTWDEALAYKRRFNTVALIVVTSSIHMPRAIETFKSVGLDPVAAPTYFLTKKSKNKTAFSFMPSSSKLLNSEKALHEYAGILYYRYFKQED